MIEFCTYTTDLNEEPIAITRPEFEQRGGLPDDWVDFIWQQAESREAACAAHDLRLDEYNKNLDDLEFSELGRSAPPGAFLIVAIPFGLAGWALIIFTIGKFRGWF